MFGMMTDTGPKFHTVLSPPPIHDLKVKVTDLENFYVNVLHLSFYSHFFAVALMDLIHVSLGD